jgi:GntR family transcriptional regulator
MANPAGMAALGPAAGALRDHLLAEITGGRPRPGERLGAERELAVRLGVSRSTLRAALDALETAGAVHRVRGRSGGIFVSERRVERDLRSLAGLPAYLRRQGFQPSARVLSTGTLAADRETASALALDEGEDVVDVLRLRLADGQPVSLERARFPAERFPGLLDRALAGSIYDLLEADYGLRVGEAEERIEVVSATAADARTLEVRPGAPLISIVRTAWAADGRPFEHSRDLFRADRVRIVARVRGREASSLGTAVEVAGRSDHHD